MLDNVLTVLCCIHHVGQCPDCIMQFAEVVTIYFELCAVQLIGNSAGARILSVIFQRNFISLVFLSALARAR